MCELSEETEFMRNYRRRINMSVSNAYVLKTACLTVDNVPLRDYQEALQYTKDREETLRIIEQGKEALKHV